MWRHISLSIKYPCSVFGISFISLISLILLCKQNVYSNLCPIVYIYAFFEAANHDGKSLSFSKVLIFIGYRFKGAIILTIFSSRHACLHKQFRNIKAFISHFNWLKTLLYLANWGARDGFYFLYARFFWIKEVFRHLLKSHYANFKVFRHGNVTSIKHLVHCITMSSLENRIDLSISFVLIGLCSYFELKI